MARGIVALIHRLGKASFMRKISIKAETWPLRQRFAIARGSKIVA